MNSFKKSFVLVKRPSTISENQNSNSVSSLKIQNSDQYIQDHIDFRRQTSNELLQIILSDLQNKQCYQPCKKVKTQRKSTIMSSNSLNLTNGCNCKKTKCLKLYCQCFSSGGYCRPGCSCLECSNNAQFQAERSIAIAQILMREPKAFSNRQFKQNKEQFKGCNCKKSQCLKKYCECYSFGIGCGSFCKCQGCKNRTQKGSDQEKNSRVFCSSQELTI